MAGLLAAIFGAGAAAASAGNVAADGGSAEKRLPSWSLQRFQALYAQLTAFRESDLERPGGGDEVVEIVRQITEALVWGEQHDTAFFDYFCEKGIFADFIRVLSNIKAPKTVKVQLLQTLSMLFQNIRRETSLIYLLSNRQVNKLISMQLDFLDEEILAYYITLLKSLAMRMDNETIKFFYVTDPEPAFPLYIGATKFFNHRDQMVRATVRTITLQVYPIEYEPMQLYVEKHAEEFYFSQLALHLRDIWLRLNKAASVTEDAAALQHENDLQQDLLIYLSDVFELGITKLNQVLAERLLDVVLMPLLVLSIESGSGPQHGTRPTQSNKMAPKVALFLLRQVFDTIKCRVLIEPLAAALLHPRVPQRLMAQFASPCPQEFHSHFVRYLRPGEDASFLFAAGIVHSCLRNRQALPPDFLEAARIFPPPPGSRFHRPEALVSEQRLDILWFLLHALQALGDWRPETFQVLVLVLLDLLLEPAFVSHPECREAARKAAQSAFDVAAENLQGQLRDQLRLAADTGASPMADDALLDVFMEEWELQKALPGSVVDVCNAAWRWLLSPAGSSSARGRGVAPPPGGTPSTAGPPPEDGARRAVRCFLLLRRLLGELAETAQDAVPQERPATALPPSRGPQTQERPATALPPSRGPQTQMLQPSAPRRCGGLVAEEVSPLQVEPSMLGNVELREGMAIDLASTSAVACSLAAPGPQGGSHSRYLVLHEAWLVLAQPAAGENGEAVVTTLWPVQQVQSLIDRGDPRVVRIGMQAFFGGGPPGEAAAYNPPVCVPDASAQRRSSYYTMALHFEDVRQCHVADQHLRRRRREVRTQLLQKASRFVEVVCML